MSERTLVEHRGHNYIKLKGGRLTGFWDQLGEAQRGQTNLSRAVSRMFKLAKADKSDYDMERLYWFVEELESYVSAMKYAMDKHYGMKSKEERIALLRNTAGRTEAEAEAYRRKADALEAALRG